jgi:hypothetical protein
MNICPFISISRMGMVMLSLKPTPIRLIENNGMKNKDLKLAKSIIEENQDIIELKWKVYFKG